MAKSPTNSDIDRVMRQLAGVVDKRGVFEDLNKSHRKTIVSTMLTTAKAGIGPNNQPYTPYKPSYQEQIDKSGEGAGKKWLVGLGRAGQKTFRGGRKKGGGRTKVSGQAGALLDPKNFSVEPPASDGPAHMVWQDTGGRGVTVYAEVHQGTAYGGKDHTGGVVPPRPYMHFDNDANYAALIRALTYTMQTRARNVKNLRPGDIAALSQIAG